MKPGNFPAFLLITVNKYENSNLLTKNKSGPDLIYIIDVKKVNLF